MENEAIQQEETTEAKNISVKNCNLWYGDFHALKNIDIEIPEKKVTAFIGPSGCGKSTFLKILNRMNDLVEGCRIEGEFKIGEKDIFAKDTDVNLLRKEVGMVFQKPNPFPMTIYDNIAFAPRTFGVRKKAALDEIVETSLKRASIWNEVKDRLKKSALGLSGGQQQRVALARILVYEPDVIMLDEPFSALDYYLKEQLQFQVREVLRGYTGDVLMVSHSRDEVYRFCEKSIILNRGQVAMKGETRAIFQKPENVTAARLTGCKNFSRIRRIGEYEVEALDWGLTFQTEEAVAAEHAYIGIRAHQFYPARGSANEFTCEWGDTLCQPFEWDVLLRPVENAGAAGDKENALEREVIWWKVDYKQSDSLNQYQRGDRVRLGIAPGDIMLLKEG